MKARLLVGIFIAAIPPLALIASVATGDNRRPTPQVVQLETTSIPLNNVEQQGLTRPPVGG